VLVALLRIDDTLSHQTDGSYLNSQVPLDGADEFEIEEFVIFRIKFFPFNFFSFFMLPLMEESQKHNERISFCFSFAAVHNTLMKGALSARNLKIPSTLSENRKI
jgi:hypothetical protein